MTERISLTGKVAVVTGAGRGLGRAHALSLAARGALVVVNDLGTDMSGAGRDIGPARQVVDEIVAAGGTAIADDSDVSTPAGARALARCAIDAFGRVDVLVNNAGIHLDRPFAETSYEDFERLWRVNVGGHVNATHAVWGTMAGQGCGRIVVTESAAGLFGLPGQTAYAATKGAVHGLMRSLALEGAAHGILVNSIAPGAYTRMVEHGVPDEALRTHMQAAMPPELTSPVVAWLASDACTCTGEVFSVWGGRVARIAIGGNLGYVDRELEVERIAANADAVTGPGAEYEPLHAFDEVQHWAAEVFAAPAAR
jgi:NAD(P)-dependent dehydrogenase (short-subunit alcohol dehydrogenase family)